MFQIGSLRELISSDAIAAPEHPVCIHPRLLQLLQRRNVHIRAEAEPDHADAHRRRIARTRFLGGD